MAKAGIYWRLRDATVPWPDKIKLARYVWSHDHVHIPNKHQVILDVIVLAVTGRKRVASDEAGPIWQCFHDMLHTQTCQHGPAFGEPLVLKGVVGQVLLEDLRAHSSGRQSHCSSSDLVVACCHAILTSRCLNEIFTNRFEVMVKLVASVIQLCMQQLSAGGAVSGDVQNLLRVALKKLNGSDWKRMQLQQVVCDHLLLTTAQFVALIADRCTTDHLNDVADQLQDSTLNVLLAKELILLYQQYIGLKMKAKTKGSLPKDIDAIFSTMTRLLASNGNSRTSMLRFLPKFFDGFLRKYRMEDPLVAMRLLMYITSIMGIDLDGNGNDPKGHKEVKADEISSIQQLLGLVVEHDSYSPAADSNEGGQQAKWLQQMASLILEQEHQSGDWYGVLRHLVRLDHTSVDNQMITLLTKCWICAPQIDEELANSATLLADLVSIYSRLRQLPILIDRCLSSVRSLTDSTQISWPPQMIDSLAVAITILPSTTCVSLWKTILVEFVSNHSQNLGEGHTSPAGIDVVSQLLSQLLLHARLADYNIAPQVAAQTATLMTSTRDDVLAPMLKASLKNKGSLHSALHLAWAWGELQLLLRQYTNFSPDGTVPDDISDPSDLRCVHPEIGGKDWAATFESVMGSGDCKSLYLLELLTVQKIKSLLLFGSRAEATTRALIQPSVTYLFDITADTSDVNLHRTWDRQVSTIDKSTHQVAHWNMICEQGALLLPFCDDVQLINFSGQILTVVAKADSESGVGLTLAGVVRTFLDSSTFKELAPLHAAITTALWRQVAQLMMSRKSPKKERKGKSIVSLVQKLGSCNVRQSQNTQKMAENEACLLEVSEKFCLTYDLEKGNMPLTPGQAAQIGTCLKILDHLPVDHFPSTHKVQCFLGLSLLAATNQPELVSTSLKQLEAVLCGGGCGALIRMVDIGLWLCWMMDQLELCEVDSQVALYNQVFMQMLKVASKDFAGMTSLEPFIAKCAEQMALKQGVLSPGGQQRNFRTAASALGILRKICERSHMSPTVKVLSLDYYRRLATPLLHLVDELGNNSQTTSDKDERMWAVLGGAYCHLLEHVCRNWRKRMWEQQAVKRRNTPGGNKDKGKINKDGTVDTSEKDPMEDKTDKDGVEDKTKKDAGEEAMEVDSDTDKDEEKIDAAVGDAARVLGVLPVLSRIASHILSSPQLIEKDSAATRNAVSLVATLCTNIAMKEVVESLPENFVYVTWQHLLAMLQQLESLHAQTSRQRISEIPRDITCSQHLKDVHGVLGEGPLPETAMDTDDCIGARDPEDKATPSGGSRMRQDVQRAITRVICVLNEDHFHHAINSLIQQVSSVYLYSSPEKIVVALETIQHLLEADLGQENYGHLRYAAQSLVIGIQEVVSECGAWEEGRDRESLIQPALTTLTRMLSHGPGLLLPRCVAMCLHSCQLAPLGGSSIENFAICHQGVCTILNEMLVHHERSVFKFIPAYISVVERLLRGVILQSDQTRCASLSETRLDLLVSAALSVNRLFTLMATHEVDFHKVAPYLVAEYVEQLQKVTVIPKVKRSFIEGIHRLMYLCDDYAIAMLHTVLAPGVREIFKTLYKDYTKYYKYTGKV